MSANEERASAVQHRNDSLVDRRRSATNRLLDKQLFSLFCAYQAYLPFDLVTTRAAAAKRTYLMCATRALRGGVRDQPLDGHHRAGRHRARREAVGGPARDAGRGSATRCTCCAPEPGLPDMVYAANGAFSVDGVVYGARFQLPAAHRRGGRAPAVLRAAARLDVRGAGAGQRGRGRLRLPARRRAAGWCWPGTGSAPRWPRTPRRRRRSAGR